MGNVDVHEQFALFFKDKNIHPFLYLLSKRMMEGHICLNLQDKLLKEELVGTVFENELLDARSLLTSIDYVSDKLEDNRPLIVQESMLYLHRYFFYETEIIKKLEQGSDITPELKESRREFLEKEEKFISELAIKENVDGWQMEEKPDWQLIGALQAFSNNFTIITGGPGTGKTTTVAKVLSLLYRENSNVKIALAAPTGKAAARMKESLKGNKFIEKWGIKAQIGDLNPTTIHILLGTKKDSPYFKKNELNKLEQDVIIIDEASMIGTALFAKMLAAIDFNKTRLVLLGDANQLASVDAGSLFGDICLSQGEQINCFLKENVDFFNKYLKGNHKLSDVPFTLTKISNKLNEHIIELKKTYRFDVNSKMGQFTKAMINSNLEKVESVLQMPEEVIIFDYKYDKSKFEYIAKEYINYIKEDNIYNALIKLNQVRVLCAVKQSKEGVYHTNERIEKFLEKHFNDLAKSKGEKNTRFKPSSDFYNNQPIIVTKNYKDLGLFNGDIGIIREEEGKLKAFFIDDEKEENAVKSFSPGFISECETVFAMTIHKSQGSEFDKILVILPKKSEVKLLTRELVYTAVTRAKTALGKTDTVAILQGPEDVLKAATMREVNRTSGITKRIKMIV